ncbi:hypothetical protein [Xanthomonas translucens]|uniref:hypothetical protein n=2 Tax=Xanthomonas campestris pv. translucens TaxID=343 RepID=UPI0002A7931D|nr:hypothetical protein [Xanthomonas translucens]ELQ05561.1 hypothetical protein A989_13729 [Xanthomonas translucens DAR61454]MBC3972902.1 hypothetical protein [Xanthomonas translucens pv. undulosa]MCT8283466.1 hypothetical protein [Xanthomonas translucens pv. undulosa]MCT8318621.1 hypothetical protein [Xanthomonas translucens pv. undulosa]QSQ56043.1 hypothetical protein ISN37_16895 [Xanthomonas translucens pv. undulosa]
MKLQQLQHRIARAEMVLEGRQQQMQTQWTTLQRVWREGWTPLRIVAVGLGAGFLAGRAEPAAAIGKIGGARWLQMLSAVSSLLTATQVKQASDQAERAADTAQDAVDPAETPAPAAAGVPGQHSAPAAAPFDPTPQVAPRAAEAATDMSER